MSFELVPEGTVEKKIRLILHLIMDTSALVAWDANMAWR